MYMDLETGNNAVFRRVVTFVLTLFILFHKTFVVFCLPITKQMQTNDNQENKQSNNITNIQETFESLA